MKSDAPLDYAAFQLSPKRSRCELFVTSDGNTEKLASGLMKPFVTHMKVAEEQVSLAVQLIKLEVKRKQNGESWFTKGTLERFVRFVSTPEVLELVSTFDAEMSQLEAARRIYSQGGSDQLSGSSGGSRTSSTAGADVTKKELLRAIDVRLDAVKQDLTAACSRAAAAGFNHDTIADLQMFAEHFGANRLNEACSKFVSLYERRPDLFTSWKSSPADQPVRSSYGSDMSIDDDTPATSTTTNPTAGDRGQESPAEQTPLVQQPKPKSFSSSLSLSSRRASSREPSVERDDVVAVTAVTTTRQADEKEKEGDDLFSQPISLPAARRLSVQDRIKLFENKQENSGGKPASGTKPAAVELRRLSSDIAPAAVELRRLSSDIAPAAVERAVLRRWSGVSDMSISIDLSGDKKETESPLCTPTEGHKKPLNEASTHIEPSKDQHDSQVKVGTSSGIHLTGSSSKLEDDSNNGSKKSASTFRKTPSWSSLSKAEDVSLDNTTTFQTQTRHFLGVKSERVCLADPLKFKSSSFGHEHGGIEEQLVLDTQSGRSVEQAGSVGVSANRSVDSKSAGKLRQPSSVLVSEQNDGVTSRDESDLHSGIRAPVKTAQDSGPWEGGSGSKIREAFTVHHKGLEAGSLASQSRLKPPAEIEEVAKRDLTSAEKHFSSSATNLVDTGISKMKYQKQARRDESNYGYNKITVSAKSVAEDTEGSGSMPTAPFEQVQRTRQLRGNQELNDELQMKANELEKLFAEHKLRAPGDQSNSARRSKPSDMEVEQAVDISHRNQVIGTAPTQSQEQNEGPEYSGGLSNTTKSIATPVKELVDDHDYGDALKQSFSEVGFSDDSRGKFYETYMQKRDAKLREEWSSKRSEKEAKMKAMQDTLERNRAEIMAKLSGTADRQNSISSARRRAERLRSFNSRSNRQREQPLDFGLSDDEENPSEFSEQKPFGQDKACLEASFNGISGNFQGKKLLPNRTSSTFTPRASAIPAPRSTGKASISGRRRMQSENPLAQSVPNFSELRKENTKPYSATSKTTARSQLRNYTRNRSTNEEIPPIKEEKPRRSQSLRKNSPTPMEFHDASAMSSEGVVLTPLKFDKVTDQTGFRKSSKTVEPKPFLRKHNGVGGGAGSGIAKMKASMVSEAVKNEEDDDNSALEPNYPIDMDKHEDEEESETLKTEDQAMIDHSEPRMSQESERLVNSESENDDGSRSFSQVDPFIATLPASVASTFHPTGSGQESPGESPMSWNSRAHHSFSYTHDASDVDASADSPIGSPASWNLQGLNQTEADAARMRKKWGSAQKPVLVANSSGSHSRKDVTKGFKRLLKFGRKSRGTESIADWISATTSEGDDDTEDGRDLANRSSEDLRKSRMGYSHGHSSEDNFNDNDFFGEQVSRQSSIPAPPANFRLREDHLSGSSIKAPRSFFSLSSFRSKGSESKPR